MNTPAKRILISGERQPQGDVGPCSHVECLERAVWILQIRVQGIEVTAWVCDQHRRELLEQ